MDCLSMPRKTTKKEPSEKLPEHIPVNLIGIGEHLASVGIPPEAVSECLALIFRDYDVTRVDRVEEFATAMFKWISQNATADGPYPCNSSELIMAIQHVQFKVFDMMRPRKTAEKLVEALANEMSKHHPHEPDDKKPASDSPPNSMYS
jgi:hypothetical protein